MRDPFQSIADVKVPSRYNGDTSGSCNTFEEALRGLTPSQQTFFESIMQKAYVLQIAGIKEQRRSVGWKWVECICVALTPIYISVSDSFGGEFQEPIKLMAILCCLFSMLCRLSPQGRGEALLFYSGLLRKVCWSYWSVSGVFQDDAVGLEDDKREKAQKFWTEIRQNKKTQLEQSQQAGQSHSTAGTEDPASSVNGTAYVDFLPDYLTETEIARAVLFQKFVSEVEDSPRYRSTLDFRACTTSRSPRIPHTSPPSSYYKGHSLPNSDSDLCRTYDQRQAPARESQHDISRWWRASRKAKMSCSEATDLQAPLPEPAAQHQRSGRFSVG